MSYADPIRRRATESFFKHGLPNQVATALEQKLFTVSSQETSSAYKLLHKQILSMLKEPTKTSQQTDKEFEIQKALHADLLSDLSTGKLKVNDFISQVRDRQKHEEKQTQLAQQQNQAFIKKEEEAVKAQYEKEDATKRYHEQEQRHHALVWGVKQAKVQIADAQNVKKPEAWIALAEASLQLYVFGTPALTYLLQATKAWARAESLDSTYPSQHPQFLSKRALVYTWLEEYALALTDLRTLSTLPSTSDMTPSPSTRITALHTYLHHIQHTITSRGKLNANKFKQLVKDLPQPKNDVASRTMIPIASLALGANDKKGVVTKVIAILNRSPIQSLAPATSSSPSTSIDTSSPSSLPPWYQHPPHAIPRSFVVCDHDGDCIAVSIYNVVGDVDKQTPVKLGDVLVLLDPMMKEISVEDGDTKISYRSLYMTNPHFCFVNYEPMRDVIVEV